MYPAFTPRERMVHQKMDIEFRNTYHLSERAIALPQIVAPFGKNVTLFLVLHEMSENPDSSLSRTLYCFTAANGRRAMLLSVRIWR